MAINTKKNVPITTPIETGQVFDNYSGEVTKITQLVLDQNRSTSGNVVWTSPTSNITYDTSEWQSNPNIYNQGDTGLYNLLIYLYGTLNDGWIVTGDDYNSIANTVNSHSETLSAITGGGGVVVEAIMARKLGTANVGSATKPIYLNAGNPTECTSLDINASTATNATYATKIGSSTSHPAIGSNVRPIYIDANGDIQVAIAYASANVGSAAKLTTPRNLQVNLANSNPASFDGSNNQTGIGVSGILSVANGGTGANSVAINQVFASPAGGSAGAPSYRSLVEADIPTLSASKIGSGAVSVARGGTGLSTLTTNAVLLGNGTGNIKQKASANGALYATGANSEPMFGVLPAAQGGTGQTSLDDVTVGNANSATTATKFNGNRSVSLTGAVTGSANWDGSGALSIATTVTNAILYGTSEPTTQGKDGDIFVLYTA